MRRAARRPLKGSTPHQRRTIDADVNLNAPSPRPACVAFHPEARHVEQLVGHLQPLRPRTRVLRPRLEASGQLVLAPSGRMPIMMSVQRRSSSRRTLKWNSSGLPTPCVMSGQDGELQTGLSREYVDNGNGTIRDMRTGLMWEKLSDDDSIHDKDPIYPWDGAFWKADMLNASGFAGHADWRVPNRREIRPTRSVLRRKLLLVLDDAPAVRE